MEGTSHAGEIVSLTVASSNLEAPMVACVRDLRCKSNAVRAVMVQPLWMPEPICAIQQRHQFQRFNSWGSCLVRGISDRGRFRIVSLQCWSHLDRLTFLKKSPEWDSSKPASAPIPQVLVGSLVINLWFSTSLFPSVHLK